MNGYGNSTRLWTVLFGPEPFQEDVARWINQKFVNSEILNFVLEQSHGGPCGVLAPVQAFSVVYCLNQGVKGIEPLMNQSLIQEAVSWALIRIMDRAATGPRTYLTHSSDTPRSFIQLENLEIGQISVLDFVASLVASRGIETVLDDMDDPSNPLISRFGHCSQELLNLVLIGRATSNVFDGTHHLGDGVMLLRGVTEDVHDVQVGLLSELESLRYVTVGSRYKNPTNPVWIIGSPSHYTMLFGFQTAKSDATERKSEEIIRVFNKFALDEGLALSENLGKILEAVGAPVNDPEASALTNEGIVLLHDFLEYSKKRGLYTEGPRDSESLDFLFINGQVPVQVLRVRVDVGRVSEPEMDSVEGSASLRAILLTRWPNSTIRISPYSV